RLACEQWGGGVLSAARTGLHAPNPHGHVAERGAEGGAVVALVRQSPPAPAAAATSFSMALDLGCDHPGLDLGENGFAFREAEAEGSERHFRSSLPTCQVVLDALTPPQFCRQFQLPLQRLVVFHSPQSRRSPERW